MNMNDARTSAIYLLNMGIILPTEVEIAKNLLYLHCNIVPDLNNRSLPSAVTHNALIDFISNVQEPPFDIAYDVLYDFVII